MQTEQGIARSLYLTHFKDIQEENEELKKEIQKLRSTVRKLKLLKGCDCNHETHWSCGYQTGCEEKGGKVCIITFSKDSSDGRILPPDRRRKFLCCSQCVDHFYYCGIDGSDPAHGMEVDFFVD